MLPWVNTIGPVKLSILASTAVSIVAIVVASKASIFFKVVVPVESSIISTPPKDKLPLAAIFILPAKVASKLLSRVNDNSLLLSPSFV